MLHGTYKANCRKNTGGKPLAMGRGKKDPKKNPTPGRADRKVVLEYSSDEENPQQVEGAAAPKRVKKQIHLTLPTSPAHVTMTESFTAFFINHGLDSSLTESFCGERLEYRPDERIRHQLPEEARTAGPNAQNLWGRRHPLMTKVWSWQTAPRWERRPLAARVAPAEANHARSLQPAVAAVEREEQAVVTAPVQVAQAGLEVESEPEMMTMMKMTLTNAGRQGVKLHHHHWWLARNHARRAQFTPRLTESCQSSTSLARKRELYWATAYWTGLMSRRGRSTRHGCRGGW